MKSILVFIFALLFSTGAFAQLEITSHENEKRSSYFYHNFGRVFTGSSHYSRYNVKNTGTTALGFKSAVIGGSIDFNAYHSCKNGIEPQKSCWFEIRYWPLFEGWSTGRFIITFDEENRIVVDLSGESYRL